MLNNINFHLCHDGNQQRLEQAIGQQIKPRYIRNLAAFEQHIPSLTETIVKHQPQHYALFCNKNGQLNQVDFATGLVMYGEQPEVEVLDEVSAFLDAAPVIYFDSLPAGQSGSWPVQPVAEQAELIVMFGLGLGWQLAPMLQARKIKYLIVYEPSIDMFCNAVKAADWQRIFQLAAEQGCQLFLQVGHDGSNFPADLAELLQHVSISQCYMYRHYHHPVMDKVLSTLFSHNGDSKMLTNSGLHFGRYTQLIDELPLRQGNCLGNSVIQPAQAQSSVLFEKNMAALAQYYPAVHKVILSFKTASWQRFIDEHGQPNLFHTERRFTLHQHAEQDAEKLYQYYLHHPSQDDIFITQQLAWKFKDYIHFRALAKTRKLLNSVFVNKSRLPEQIDSLIMFGIGLGRYVELLTERQQVTNLFLCEPNLDYFYHSLFITDWAALFERAQQQNCRIYLNLGGDGSRYFYDLMSQFYQVGAYAVANTYLMVSYYNSKLHRAIAELKDSMRVVMATGEFYEHARYTIAHTHHSLTHRHKFLLQDIAALKRHPLLDVPVFVVGNGPSLDNTISFIQQYRQQAIVIGCGTVLKALYKNGIKPDFHAELEQNRSSYDWVTHFGEPGYLKSIRILGVNGLHPDTAALFADAIIAFKAGESASLLFQHGLKQQGVELAALRYCYPTVTNMAMNILLHCGFKTIYLFGVDLGFHSFEHHHSKDSAYYDAEGKPLYDYQSVSGGGLSVPGNFRPQVLTKPEFDISRKLIEQTIASAGYPLEVYNCSDGAAIQGATPLAADNILLAGTDYTADLLADFLSKACRSDLATLAETVYQQFDHAKVASTIQEWLKILPSQVVTEQDARQLLLQQWHFLLKHFKKQDDPTFTLLNGSSNYFSAILTKVAAGFAESTENLSVFNQILTIWREYLEAVQLDYNTQPLKFDQVIAVSIRQAFADRFSGNS